MVPFRNAFWSVILLGVTLCWLSPTVEAQGTLITTDVTYQAIEFKSHAIVQTWEQDGVRVFLATDGGEVRQGSVRVVAPVLVLLHDKNESRRPDVRSAVVWVYAEGTGEPGGLPTTPVRLVEGETVREGGVVGMRLRSKLAFVWEDSRLRELKGPRSLPVLHRAEAARKQAEFDFISDRLPEAPAEEWKEAVLRTIKQDDLHLSFDEQEQKWTGVFMGDVRMPYGNFDLSADVVVIWFDETTRTYEVYARGDCRIARRPGTPPAELSAALPGLGEQLEVLRADQIYINESRQRGLARRAELRFSGYEEEGPEAEYTPTPEERQREAERTGDDFFEDVWVVQGRDVYMLDSKNLYIRQGSFATSSFAHPNFHISGEEVRVVREDPSVYVMVWDPRFRVGKQERVLFGLPFFAMDVGEREGYVLRSVLVGTSSKFGPFVRSAWRPTHLGLGAEWIKDWTVSLDYYGARGPAIGTELDYEFEHPAGVVHSGEVLGYYVRDSGNEDDTETAVPEIGRGRLRLRHRAQWTPDWRTDVELYYLSDEAFLREYFESEFEDDKPPETYVFTRYRKGSLWGGLLYKTRINEFLSQVEETPSGELHWVAVPLGSGLVYDAALKAGYFNLQISDQLGLPDPPGLFRVHTDHRISWPFNVGFVRVDPFLRALGTVASRSVGSGGSFSGAVSRFGAGGGVRASAEFSRSYNVVNEPLRVNRIRHVVTPYVELEALPLMTADSRDFIQMGFVNTWPGGGRAARAGRDFTDAIDARHQLRLGLRQRLQTKRRAGAGRSRTVDWMELDIAVVARRDDSVAVPIDDNYLEADFELRLTPNITIHSRDDRLSLGDGVDVLNVGTQVRLSERTGFDVSYHHISNKSASVVATAWTKLSDRYGLRVRERFELGTETEAAGNLETLIVLQRFFNKWLLEFGLHHEKSNEDFALIFNLLPRGFGTGLSFVGVGDTQ